MLPLDPGFCLAGSHKSSLVRCPYAFLIAQARAKRLSRLGSFPKVSLHRRTVLALWAVSVFLAGVVLSRNFEVWNIVLRDRCSTWDTVSFVWHMWHFLRVAKTLKPLAGLGQNERWFWR